ncbi:hypothetical protein S40285_04970 [Stachybotrys chlorohalonatus IBT 40285]|uniref:Transcription activator GCR1-like domain-containing protein n=1 Tax=Stachybotrys chlorohalonatus (strain IBT 40285) TaxID=1283841 RepID=A0A084QUJ9_STAC4|nr:hypothetical protein S40285_04970 [Stachybotrys chlorohalonata IBT 40285]
MTSWKDTVLNGPEKPYRPATAGPFSRVRRHVDSSHGDALPRPSTTSYFPPGPGSSSPIRHERATPSVPDTQLPSPESTSSALLALRVDLKTMNQRLDMFSKVMMEVLLVCREMTETDSNTGPGRLERLDRLMAHVQRFPVEQSSPPKPKRIPLPNAPVARRTEDSSTGQVLLRNQSAMFINDSRRESTVLSETRAGKRKWARLSRSPQRKMSRISPPDTFDDRNLRGAIEDIERSEVQRLQSAERSQQPAEHGESSHAGGSLSQYEDSSRAQPSRGWVAINHGRDDPEGGVMGDGSAIGKSDVEEDVGLENNNKHGHNVSQMGASSRPNAPPASLTNNARRAKPRYSVPRQTGERIARGPADRPFVFKRMPRTVAGIWAQWKHGTDGNLPLEHLERTYGTGWRSGDTMAVKYGSNYVGTRKKVVRYVEAECRARSIDPDEFCRTLDAHVDRRIQELIGAIQRDQDPFEAIERRN